MGSRGVVPLLLVGLLSLPALAGGEIHGTVLTDRGERLTGPIRWDHNENFWDDILDARKILEDEQDGTSISIFGWKIRNLWRDKRYGYLNVPFGHIQQIERVWGRGARITLKGGLVLDAEESADLGRSMRGLVVRDSARGDVELDWDDVDRVTFHAGPGEGRDRERLYGDVVTAAGTFRGFIVWDKDESLREDILDGREERDRRRKIAFREIKEIERLGSRGSRVTLSNGDTVVLDGTNDVDSGHRGIDLTVPGVGRLEIGWRDVERVIFTDPPASRTYDSFDGGGPLRGTVTTDRGATTGRIVWDRDERYRFELLDGERDRIEYGIPFENIRAIRPRGPDDAEVELLDGTVLVLGGSNDVNYGNRGITVVGDDGVERDFEWDEVRSVSFSGS